MKKIRFAVHKDELSRVFDVMQEKGVVEVEEVKQKEELNKKDLTRDKYKKDLQRIENILSFLFQYKEKKKGLPKPAAEQPSITEKRREELLKEVDYCSVLDEAEDLQAKISKQNDELKKLNEEEQFLKEWSAFSGELENNLSTKRTKTLFFKKTDHKNDLTEQWQKLQEFLSSKPSDLFNAGEDKIVLTVMHEDIDEAVGLAKKAGYETVDLPEFSGTPQQELEKNLKNKEAHMQELDKLQKEARALAGKYIYDMRILRDVIAWEKDKEDTLSVLWGTEEVLFFEGWCPAQELPVLEGEIKKEANLFEVKEIDAGDEEPPVEIDNNSIIKPLESVTRLYGLPGYKDLDPTIYLAGFFVISFGLALTDLGYGLFLMILSAIALLVFKLQGAVKLYLKTLFAGGCAASFFGLLTGGFLGIDVEALPVFMQRLQGFDLIENPLPVFYFSLGIGVVQVLFGMVLKIVREHRNGNTMEGVMMQGPWLLLFASAILYGASTLGYLAISTDVLLWAIYASAGAIVLSGVLLGKTISQRVSKGLIGLYNGIGYFSDILSYSRLFALGLATTALAFSVNLIAMIIIESMGVVGYLFAAVVFVVGHLFNIVVNTLGAFIHSARLQFVEFFGKFIEGTGRSFTPLKRNSLFVTDNKNINNN